MVMRKVITFPATVRMLLALLMVGTSGALGTGNAVAGSGDAQRFTAIADAYRARRAWTFTQLLQKELRGVRSLEPAGCASRQLDLIAIGRKRGFDGLEALALAHHDCMASTRDLELQRKLPVMVDELARSLWFSAPPIPNLPQRVARRDTLVERGVEGLAVRSVLQTLARERRSSAHLDLGGLLQHPAVGQALCDLPLRPGPGGVPSGASLARVAMCEGLGTPGGRGSLDALCSTDARGEAAWERIGTSEAAAIPDAASDKDAQSAAELAASTCRGGVGFGSLTGIDPLDAFSIDTCIGGDPTAQAGAVDVAELVQDCFAAADDETSWDPAASDGDDEPEPAVEPTGGQTGEEEAPAEEKDGSGSGDTSTATTDDGGEKTSPEAQAVGQTVGAVGDAANVLEIQMILTEAAAGEAAAGAGIVAEWAGAIGLVITVGTIANEVYDSLVGLSKYTRENGDCWPNCHHRDDPETGPATGSFDPQNEACQALVELGLVAPGAEIEESEIPPVAIIQPSPEAEDLARSSDGFCGAGVGMGLDDAARCRVDKDCGPFADLGADCSCRPRSGSAAAFLAQTTLCTVMLDCPDGTVVSESGQCFCDSGDETEVEGRWGQPGAPDPVGGRTPSGF